MDKKEGIRAHHVDVLAALLLLAAFAVCILTVLLRGTGIYRELTARDAASFAQTSRALYISTKLRQAENAGAVSEETVDGVSVLVIRSVDAQDDPSAAPEQAGEARGEVYLTRIYASGGWIRELYAKEAYPFSIGDGEKVSEAEEMTAVCEDGLITVTLRGKNGETETVRELLH